MPVFPPQEALWGLWLVPPPASMQQKALGLSCGSAGWGGQPVTWKWLLTLWSKGHHLASPATGHAGSRALPCWRLTEVAEQSKEKPHVVTFLRMSLSMSVPPVTAFRSARPVQTRGAGGCVFFCPFLLDSSFYPTPMVVVCFSADDIPAYLMNTEYDCLNKWVFRVLKWQTSSLKEKYSWF